MKRNFNIWNRPVDNQNEEALRNVKSKRHDTNSAVKKRTTPPEVAPGTQSEIENQQQFTKGDSSYFRSNDSHMNMDEMIDLSHVKVEKRGRSSVLSRSQVRRNTLSISVSEEEETLLRKGAANAGMGFSAWARKVLFNSLRRKVPKRPTN